MGNKIITFEVESNSNQDYYKNILANIFKLLQVNLFHFTFTLQDMIRI